MEKKDIEFLNEHNKDSNFSEVQILLSSKMIDNNDSVINEIKNFQPNDGWVSFQSTSAKRINSADFDSNGENILAGEFHNSQGVSLSIRFDGEKWGLYSCKEDGEGEFVLKRNVKQLSKINDKTCLNYSVYYKFDAEIGYRPYCSAFKGFTEENK